LFFTDPQNIWMAGSIQSSNLCAQSGPMAVVDHGQLVGFLSDIDDILKCFDAWQKAEELSEGLPLFHQCFTTVNTLSLIDYVKKTIQVLEHPANPVVKMQHHLS